MGENSHVAAESGGGLYNVRMYLPPAILKLERWTSSSYENHPPLRIYFIYSFKNQDETIIIGIIKGRKLVV